MNVVVSSVLIISFSIIIVSMVLQFGVPIIQEKKAELEFEEGKNLVNHISMIVNDLAAEPIGSSAKIPIEFRIGRIKFSNNTISFYFELEKYSKEFGKIKFNELEVPSGKANLTMEKISVNEISIKLNQP